MDICSIMIELGIEILGAFLGFSSALYVSHLTKKTEKTQTKVKIIKNLSNELNDIRSVLERYVKMKVTLSSLIYTPTWDALQHSGMTLELITEDYYNDIIKTYSLIYNTNSKIRNNQIISEDELLEIIKSCTTTQHIIVN